MSALTKIRVLVVDDSALVRRALTEALSQDAEIEVVGSAGDAYAARDKILELNPDVLTLDIDMPRMDGLTFLRTLQQHRPMRVVVVSSLTQAGSGHALEALAAGALDIVAKPASVQQLGELRNRLTYCVKAAARARLGPLQAPRRFRVPPAPAVNLNFDPRQLILIGASTGGTEAIECILSALPERVPGICIVQHIPAGFSTAFANRLNDCCRFEVREAKEGDEVRPGLALVAPGDYHMTLVFDGSRCRAHLDQGPMLHFTRPSVDALFNSAAPSLGPGSIAVLLTGMGVDGAAGMQQLKAQGATTIAQDESTSVVYGMPRAAVELGSVNHIVPLGLVPNAILAELNRASRGQDTVFKFKHPNATLLFPVPSNN